MRLKINGELVDKDVQNVAELLSNMGLSASPVAVEVNKKLVPKNEHEKARLYEMDQVEIVTFVGGG